MRLKEASESGLPMYDDYTETSADVMSNIVYNQLPQR